MNSARKIIDFSQVTFSYSSLDEAVLKRVNLGFSLGEFSLVAGPTGSGKTTLLKIINQLSPTFTGGNLIGSIRVADIEIAGLQPFALAESVGYVDQNPEESFATDTVIEELAYGMEQLGFSQGAMQENIDRVAKLVGVSHLMQSRLTDLSGGEQQRVAIAAALAAGQKILLLDEPTSALDAEIAAELILLLKRLTRENDTTVIITEHRIERVLEHVDSVVIVHADGSVTKGPANSQFSDYRIDPPIVALGKKLGWSPVEINPAVASERWSRVKQNYRVTPFSKLNTDTKIETKVVPDLQNKNAAPRATIRELSVSYGSTQVLRDLSFELYSGQVAALVGVNGSGKTSTLWAIQGSSQGASRSLSGAISVLDQDPAVCSPAERLALVAMVPQRASDLLFLSSLGKELAESDAVSHSEPGRTARIFESLAGRIDPDIHPRDLSSGQQLALVLAAQLVKDAPLILLDEPTRGLDYEAKHRLAQNLQTLRGQGKTILLASHDVEFIAEVCDRVMILESGEIKEQGKPSDLFTPESKYATQLTRITNTAGLLSVQQIEVLHAK